MFALLILYLNKICASDIFQFVDILHLNSSILFKPLSRKGVVPLWNCLDDLLTSLEKVFTTNIERLLFDLSFHSLLEVFIVLSLLFFFIITITGFGGNDRILWLERIPQYSLLHCIYFYFTWSSCQVVYLWHQLLCFTEQINQIFINY